MRIREVQFPVPSNSQSSLSHAKSTFIPKRYFLWSRPRCTRLKHTMADDPWEERSALLQS